LGCRFGFCRRFHLRVTYEPPSCFLKCPRLGWLGGMGWGTVQSTPDQPERLDRSSGVQIIRLNAKQRNADRIAHADSSCQ